MHLTEVQNIKQNLGNVKMKIEKSKVKVGLFNKAIVSGDTKRW